MEILEVIFAVAIAFIGLGIALALYRAIIGPDGATRAVISDLVFFSTISLVGIIGILNGSSIVFDVIVIAGLLGAVSSIALARVINRGHR
ncbi:MAG: monovalent cation/H+ antiporter complex subunit F [Lawsonella sp.]